MKQIILVSTDLRGSTRAVCDSNGKPGAWLGADPFGSRIASACGGDSNTIDRLTRRYTGQVFEQESGLYHYGARLYDDALARFVTADTAHQTPDPYAYCGNDPVDHVDPTGRVGLTIIYFDGWFMLVSSRTIPGSSTRTLTKLIFVFPATTEALQRTSLIRVVKPGPPLIVNTAVAVLQPLGTTTGKVNFDFDADEAGQRPGALKNWDRQRSFWNAFAYASPDDALALLKSLAVRGDALPLAAQSRLRYFIRRTVGYQYFRYARMMLQGVAPQYFKWKSIPGEPGAIRSDGPIKTVEQYVKYYALDGKTTLSALRGEIPDLTYFSEPQLQLLAQFESACGLTTTPTLVTHRLLRWALKHGVVRWNTPQQPDTTTTTTTTTTTVATHDEDPPGPTPHTPSAPLTEDDEPNEKTEPADMGYL